MTTPQPQFITGNIFPVPGGPGCMDAVFAAVWDAQPGDTIIVPNVTHVRIQAYAQLIALGKLGSVTVISLAPVELGK